MAHKIVINNYIDRKLIKEHDFINLELKKLGSKSINILINDKDTVLDLENRFYSKMPEYDNVVFYNLPEKKILDKKSLVKDNIPDNLLFYNKIE